MASQNNKANPKKPKLVRDSFTIPKAEFAAIEQLKDRAISLGTSVKKSELLRAGLMSLQGLSDSAYKAALSAVPTLKTGRPAVVASTAPTKAAPKPASKSTAKATAKPPAKKAATKPMAAPTKSAQRTTVRRTTAPKKSA